MTTLEKAKTFIYKNARPLDFARWQYHFEKGSKEAVLNALSHYQNQDGGFGHALEADSWNPNSSPIQTWTATEILHEIDFTDPSHPIISGILSYLASGKDFEGSFWYNTIKSNNDYPHAPWWHTESESTCHNDYNPTACLASFILRFADKESALYNLAQNIATQAFEHLINTPDYPDMHTAGCYIRMLEYCKASKSEIFDTDTLENKLRQIVSESITKDTSEWETGYICKPSQFMNGNSSIFYADNKELADFECNFILSTQLDDGSWKIPWSWSDYPNEWAISKNWWKSTVIILNLLYLKGMHHPIFEN